MHYKCNLTLKHPYRMLCKSTQISTGTFEGQAYPLFGLIICWCIISVRLQGHIPIHLNVFVQTQLSNGEIREDTRPDQ